MNVALHSAGLDILSICTGGGGLDLGLGLALPGARSVCMVEREAFAVAHLVSAMEQGVLHPAPVWSDARTFDGRAWRGCVDGLVGGIPCQPHSLAGKKQGQLDARDLWSDARRIVVQSRAWFVLIENVGGMLTAGADEVAGAERVWRDLRKLGFAVEAGLFTAAEVGASHERARIFILGVHDGLADGDDARLEGHGRPDQRAGERPLGPRGGELVDAALVGRREGRAEPGLRRGRPAAAGAGEPVGDADQLGECEPDDEDGAIPRRFPRHSSGWAGIGLFPPGPDNADGWRSVLAAAPQLEPAVRRMADGLAAVLDDARQWGRVDRLRLLGNGVVPLAAAYAVRTLSNRLAGGGSVGAARLVRMMGENR